jgi:hypothetical protein
VPKEAKAAGEYALGRDRHETERLQSQAGFIEPFTERLFRDAGIGIGMKVLDVGSGAVAQRLEQVRLNSWAQRARVTVRSADKTDLPRSIACVVGPTSTTVWSYGAATAREIGLSWAATSEAPVVSRHFSNWVAQNGACLDGLRVGPLWRSSTAAR